MIETFLKACVKKICSQSNVKKFQEFFHDHFFFGLFFLRVHDDEAPWYQFNAPLTMWFFSSLFFLFPLFMYSKTNWKVKIPKCLIIGPHWSKSFNRNVTWLVKMLNIYRHCRSTLLWVLLKQIFHFLTFSSTDFGPFKSFLVFYKLKIIWHDIKLFS